ncbi:MAG TPA: TIGR00303 family protein [Methanocella sp.]|nr:TIGR00303 family protein [Methanocella sp.]
MVVDGISYFNGAEKFAEKIRGQGSYVLLMGNTDTALIPGITAAGISPEMTPYTPPLDAELVHTGRILTLGEMALTPEFIPTPGLITRAVITLSDFREFYVDAGISISPLIPHFRVGNISGKDIRTGKAVSNVREIIENAKKVGAVLASESEYLVIGESIAAGTTTALGVLLAMGQSMDGYTSSSLKVNPQSLKSSVALEGLRNAGITQPVDPVRAIEAVGDPMMAGALGLILGAKNVPIILAGGTQMATVAVLLSKLVDIRSFDIALATTRWVAKDSSSNLFGILEQGNVEIPVMTADLSFARSKFDGLKAYENGHVKEGVGAGGISVAAMLKGIRKEQIEDTVEFMYSKMIGQ